jgi:hypothetical protein
MIGHYLGCESGAVSTSKRILRKLFGCRGGSLPDRRLHIFWNDSRDARALVSHMPYRCAQIQYGGMVDPKRRRCIWTGFEIGSSNSSFLEGGNDCGRTVQVQQTGGAKGGVVATPDL